MTILATPNDLKIVLLRFGLGGYGIGLGVEGFVLKLPLKVGSVGLTLRPSAGPKGTLAVEILKANFSGFGAFGLVKTTARKLIVEKLTTYSGYFTTSVDSGGRIILAFSGVQVVSARANNLGISLGLFLD